MDIDRLKQCVQELFRDYLDVVEESESGTPFHPVNVTCSRAMMLEGLQNLLTEMKHISEEE